MATVESENQGWHEQDLDELFRSIDIGSIKKPFNEYLAALNALYSMHKADESSWLMRHFQQFNLSSLDNDNLAFVTESLKHANYDENALQGEQIVLFKEPVLVSELYCSRVLYNDGTDVVRLISYNGFAKKVVTKRVFVNHTSDNKSAIAYQIHDVAHGLILPRHADFLSLKLVTLKNLLTSPDKIDSIQKALKNAQEIPVIAIENTSKIFSEINMILRRSVEKINTLQSEIQLQEQQRQHLESIISNTQNTLKSVQKDHDKVSQRYQTIISQLSDKEDQIEDIEGKIEASKKLYESEDSKLKSVKEEFNLADTELTEVKMQLAETKRKRNATSFDTAGHTEETKVQLKAYYCFAFLTFIGLACMAIYVYTNGQNFSDTLPYLVNVSAWDILLSRLPLVTATTLIIGGLSGVFFYLIKHIVSLNTEKMTMLKAGILAEQITNSLACKNMTEEEILEFKRDTKIKLIMQVFSKQDKDTNNLIIEALKTVSSK
ncbi:hypothetical protein M2F98_00715 [Vibrio vulnificus]|nr:hypothetical protein [Vibrio vulnificus]